jgi:probable HAF family extracellular repeat protein
MTGYWDGFAPAGYFLLSSSNPSERRPRARISLEVKAGDFMSARILILVLILGILPSAMSGAGPRYERIDFPAASGHTITLYELNDRSQVLGGDCASGTCDLFLWTERHGSRVIDGIGYYNYPHINNDGHVLRTRSSGGGSVVEIWTEQKGWTLIAGMDASFSKLTDTDMFHGSGILGVGLWTPKDGFFPFVVPPGQGQYHLLGINDDGARAGYVYIPCNSGPCFQHPIMWTKSAGVVDLGVLPGAPQGQASVINDRGSVGGILYDATVAANRRLFLWTPKDGMQDVGECIGCTSPEALNKHDEIAGRIWTATIRSYFWSRRTGLFDIGTLGGDSASMRSMNDRGEIVGESPDRNGIWHAFFWSEKDGMIDLTPNDWGVGLAINNDGLIMGRSVNGFCVWRRVSGR